jgi:hypothetical protein
VFLQAGRRPVDLCWMFLPVAIAAGAGSRLRVFVNVEVFDAATASGLISFWNPFS